MSTVQKRTAQAKKALLGTFALTVLLNLADAFRDLSSSAWTALRLTVTCLFTIALISFIALHFSDRRRQRS